jgi:hypothetical protein
MMEGRKRRERGGEREWRMAVEMDEDGLRHGMAVLSNACLDGALGIWMDTASALSRKSGIVSQARHTIMEHNTSGLLLESIILQI